MGKEWRDELVTKGAVVDALKDNTFRLTLAEEQRCEGHVVWDEDVVFADVLEKALLALPPAQPECTRECMPMYADVSDNISRQDAIDALGEKPLVWDDLSDFDLGKAAQWSDDVDAIKVLPSAQPECKQECMPMYANVCDTISRQAAIDALCKAGCDSGYCGVSCDDVKAIENLPSAQPQRMKGRWIGYAGTIGAECSECHKWIDVIQGTAEMNYCPNCGADMRGEDDA